MPSSEQFTRRWLPTRNLGLQYILRGLVFIASFHRDIVKASHLTPLERKDLMDAARKQPWNPLVSTGHTISSDPFSAPIQQNVTPLANDGKPQRTQDFVRHWKGLKGQPLSQYRYSVILLFPQRILSYVFL